jgi:hypothetical protein
VDPGALLRAWVALRLAERGEVSLEEFIAIINESMVRLRKRGYEVDCAACAMDLVVVDDGKVRLSKRGIGYLKILKLLDETT